MYQRLIWAVVAILGISAASVAAEADDEATMIVAPGAAIILQPADPSHRVEVAIDGGLVQPVRGALRAPDSGKHWLSVVSRDAGGNVSEARWYYLVVDDEAPAVELDFSKPPAADVHDVEWLQAGTTVTTRAVDRLSGLSGVSLEASGPADSDLEAAGEVDATLRLTAEGTYELRAEAMDVVENRSEVVSATYRVDGTGPEGRIFAEGPHIEAEGRFILGPGAELHVEMNDELSGLVHWSPLIDGTEVEKPDFHSGWAAGEHTASGHMMDLVGNHAKLTPQSFYFDDQGPEVQWQIENEIRSGCSERQLLRSKSHSLRWTSQPAYRPSRPPSTAHSGMPPRAPESSKATASTSEPATRSAMRNDDSRAVGSRRHPTASGPSGFDRHRPRPRRAVRRCGR